MSATESDSLRLRLEVPDRVDAGDTLPMTLRVENVADGPIDLYLTGRPIAFDLIITDAEGAVVWRRLADQVIPAILRIQTLGPGETLELTDRWDQRADSGDIVPPGEYSVHGELLTEDRPLLTPVERFRIRGS